ncbi:MAG TPA: TSUP family transporter, partial [bacterium]|nr:TSUP family transporter [bacterium]
LTLIQSIFGIGILVFGTPLLLLLGLSFADTLLYLLPCSLMVSILQVRESGTAQSSPRQYLRYTVPGVFAGLGCAFYLFPQLQLRTLVGLLLVGTAFIRVSATARARLHAFSCRYASPYLLALGIIHGMTNLGGGLLVIFCSARYADKTALRNNVALGYLILAGSQLLFLIPYAMDHLRPLQLLLPLLAGGMYLGIGRHLFRCTGCRTYNRLFTTLLLAMGCVLFIT